MKFFLVQNKDTGLHFSEKAEVMRDEWKKEPFVLVEERDLSQEVAVEDQKRADRQARKDQLRALRDKGNLNITDLAQAIKHLIKETLGE